MTKEVGLNYLGSWNLNQQQCYSFALWFKQWPNFGTVYRCPEN